MQDIGYSYCLYIFYFLFYFFFLLWFFLSSFFFPDYRVRSTWWQIYLSIYHQMGTRSVPVGTKWHQNFLTPFPSLLGCFRPLKSTRAQSMDSPGQHQSPLFEQLVHSSLARSNFFEQPFHNSMARSNFLSGRPTTRWPAQTFWAAGPLLSGPLKHDGLSQKH